MYALRSIIGWRRNAAINSMTTSTPTDRQIKYWNASACVALRAVTAPKLHTTPAPRAMSDAAIGMWLVCREEAVVALAVMG